MVESLSLSSLLRHIDLVSFRLFKVLVYFGKYLVKIFMQMCGEVMMNKLFYLPMYWLMLISWVWFDSWWHANSSGLASSYQGIQSVDLGYSSLLNFFYLFSSLLCTWTEHNGRKKCQQKSNKQTVGGKYAPSFLYWKIRTTWLCQFSEKVEIYPLFFVLKNNLPLRTPVGSLLYSIPPLWPLEYR